MLYPDILGNSKFNISGTVTETDGTPIPGVGVVISSTKQVTTTNREGYFVFKSLLPDNYVITLTLTGYHTVSDTILLNADKHLIYKLLPDIIRINEVVVRENYENSRNKIEVLSLEVIKKDFIIENNSGNLIKTIEKLPGVYSMDIGSGFSKPVIRGMGFNRVVVSENGVKQEGQQWGADHGLELDQFNVEQINVYKGPMSLQYGSDAIAGVIDIVAAAVPLNNQKFGEVTFIGKSNNNLLGISAMAGIKQNAWYAKTRFTGQDFADYQIPTDTVVYLTRKIPIYNRKLKNTAGYERDFSGTFGYNGKILSSFITLTNVYQNTGFFPGSHGLPDVARVKDDGNRRDTDLPFSNVNHLKVISNNSLQVFNWKTSLDIAFQNNHRQEWSKFHTHYGNQPVPIVNPNLEIDFDLKTYTGNLKFESGRDSNWHHLTGLSAEYQTNSIAGYNFLLPEYTKFSSGIYWLETYKINYGLKFTGGIRFDFGQTNILSFHDTVLQQYLQAMNIYSAPEIAFYSQRSFGIRKQFSNLSWSVGMVWNPDNQQTYKVNIGHSFRLPGANELASNGVHHGTYRHELGDTSLKSEKGYQLDVAYTLENSKFYISVNPFAGWFSNFIYLNPTGKWSVLPHAGQIYRYQQAKAFIGGGECTVNYELLRNITFESSMEYVYMQNLGDGYPLPFSPPLSVLTGITWHWHSDRKMLEEIHFKIEHQFVAKQNRIARTEDISKSYHLFGASIDQTYRLGKTNMNVSLHIQNLLNNRYFNHLSFYRKLNIPEAGRNAQLIVRIPIN